MMTGVQRPIRGDFARDLQNELQHKLGQPNSEIRERLERIYDQVLTDGKFDLSKLPEDAQRDLRKLEKASEQFESFFVKKLLTQMRATSFAPEKGPMMDFAKETMDQAVADEAARGQGSLGIARQVFLSQAVRLVQENATKPAA